MARTVYVDTSRTASRTADGKRKKRRPHYVYDGEKVFEVDKLTKLKNVEEVFIDTLFPEIYEEVLELLNRGVRVYLLRDTMRLKKLRKENNLKKSDEVDAQLLSIIPKDGFRLLMVEELEFKIRLRPLINRYEQVVRWRATLKKLLSRGFDYNFRESIRLMESDRRRISREIIREMSDNNVYKEVCRLLGVKNSVELAILTLELPLHLSITRLKGLLGFTPDKNKGRYIHRLRKHIAALATNLYINAKKNINISDKVVEVANHLPKELAIYKIQLIILKSLRKAYLLTVNPTGR